MVPDPAANGCLCSCCFWKETLKGLEGFGCLGRSLPLIPTGLVGAAKRVGSMMAVVALLEKMRLVAPTIATEGAKGRVWLAWCYGEPQRPSSDRTLPEAVER